MKAPLIHQGTPAVNMGVAHPRYFVGIDPDTDKSGLVLVDKQERRIVSAEALELPALVDHLRMIAQEHDGERDKVLVIIEDSDTSINWHVERLLKSGYPLIKKLREAAAIGRSAGMCHATLRHIQQFAESAGLPVMMQRPLRKCWRGHDGKITQVEAEQFMTGLPKRTNQEVRDAALLAWAGSGLPMRINPNT